MPSYRDSAGAAGTTEELRLPRQLAAAARLYWPSVSRPLTPSRALALPRLQARCVAGYWLVASVSLSSLHPQSQWLGSPGIRSRESHDASNLENQSQCLEGGLGALTSQ